MLNLNNAQELSKDEMREISGGKHLQPIKMDDPSSGGGGSRQCECNDGLAGYVCTSDQDCIRAAGPGCWCQV